MPMDLRQHHPAIWMLPSTSPSSLLPTGGVTPLQSPPCSQRPRLTSNRRGVRPCRLRSLPLLRRKARRTAMWCAGPQRNMWKRWRAVASGMPATCSAGREGGRRAACVRLQRRCCIACTGAVQGCTHHAWRPCLTPVLLPCPHEATNNTTLPHLLQQRQLGRQIEDGGCLGGRRIACPCCSHS